MQTVPYYMREAKMEILSAVNIIFRDMGGGGDTDYL